VFQTIFHTYIGSAIGGLPFSPNPVIAAVDRGGNTVTTVTSKVCTASLSSSPSGSEILQPSDLLTVQFTDGLAKFFGMYINTAGYPYTISFNSSLETVSMLASLHSYLNLCRILYRTHFDDNQSYSCLLQLFYMHVQTNTNCIL
jgi:hypothetical protein